jgi:hypothetical protein
MKKKAVCPSGNSHNEFIAGVTVRANWKVDEYGELLSEVEHVDVVAYPSTNQVWSCVKCGADAQFVEHVVKLTPVVNEETVRAHAMELLGTLEDVADELYCNCNDDAGPCDGHCTHSMVMDTINKAKGC